MTQPEVRRSFRLALSLMLSSQVCLRVILAVVQAGCGVGYSENGVYELHALCTALSMRPLGVDLGAIADLEGLSVWPGV